MHGFHVPCFVEMVSNYLGSKPIAGFTISQFRIITWLDYVCHSAILSLTKHTHSPYICQAPNSSLFTFWHFWIKDSLANSKFSRRQIISLRFSNWDTSYSLWKNPQKPPHMFLILKKSCLTENISNRSLNFILKWVEYVLLIVFSVARSNNEFGGQINRISNDCLWNCRY